MNQGNQGNYSNTVPGRHYSGPMVDANQVDQQQCARMEQNTGGLAGNTGQAAQAGQAGQGGDFKNRCNKDFSGPMVNANQVDQCEEAMKHHQTSGNANLNQRNV